jgi:hypothetical protein
MGGEAAAARERGRRILVAVDEGDESVQALRWCLSTFAAAARGDTVILLYVRPEPPNYSMLDPSGTHLPLSHCVLLPAHSWPTSTLFRVANGPALQAAVGYMFAEEVTAAIDKYSREVADAVVEKAQKLCTLYSKVLETDDAQKFLLCYSDELGNFASDC